LFAISDIQIISLLKTHGIRILKLKKNTMLHVEKFTIDELSGSKRINQGHYTNSIVGKYVQEENEFPAGTYVVTTDQKLGSLSAALLEPQAIDGLLKWNYFDRYLSPQWGSGFYPYPVYRLMDNDGLKLE
ncbi:MAG: hypothetical protein H8E34_05220, partial [Bacteroidetes bacterium]|nr:hypothetical protein [Bacteroidota bacterium]